MKLHILSLVLVPVVLSGCATREYVDNLFNPLSTQVKSMDTRLSTAESDLKAQAARQQQTDAAMGEVQGSLKMHADHLARNDSEIAQLSKTAQEALERATSAGKMAAGKLTYEVVLTDDKLKFASGKAVLGGVAEATLDEFVARLKGDNQNVYIEIQGHTDSRGEAPGNMKLGEARAEAVKRYLNMKGGIPLHRMSTISYGESEPIGDNRVKAGRSQNRRVVLVVVQ